MSITPDFMARLLSDDHTVYGPAEVEREQQITQLLVNFIHRHEIKMCDALTDMLVDALADREREFENAVRAHGRPTDIRSWYIPCLVLRRPDGQLLTVGVYADDDGGFGTCPPISGYAMSTPELALGAAQDALDYLVEHDYLDGQCVALEARQKDVRVHPEPAATGKPTFGRTDDEEDQA